MKTLPKQLIAILFAALSALLIAQQPDPNQKQKEIKGATAWEFIAKQQQMALARNQAVEAEAQFNKARDRSQQIIKQLCEAEKAPLDACQIAVGAESITVVWREAPKPEKKDEKKKADQKK